MSELNPHKVGISVPCAVCRQTKAPSYRSVPTAMANSLCDWDCPGYKQNPLPGSLWPNETEAEFGFPVGDAGTKIVREREEPKP